MIVQRGAVLSPDRQYRYFLTRWWEDVGNGYSVNFIGLNPSTADADIDDPTIRRCMGFARSWGFSGLTMTNLFAYRSTDWRVLRNSAMPRVGDVVGSENDVHLVEQARGAGRVVLAWGAHAREIDEKRIAQVMGLLSGTVDLYCLGRTKEGHPRHPLYLRHDTPLLEVN